MRLDLITSQLPVAMPLDPFLCQSLLQLPLPIPPPVLCQSVIVYVILSAVSFLFHALLLLIDWSVSAEHPVGHTVALNATVTVTAVCALSVELLSAFLPICLDCPVLSCPHIISLLLLLHSSASTITSPTSLTLASPLSSSPFPPISSWRWRPSSPRL